MFDFFLKIEVWNIEKLAFVCDYNGLYAEKYMFRKCKRWQISNAKAIFKMEKAVESKTKGRQSCLQYND